MSPIQHQVNVLKARFITHRRETDGFKWDFMAASDSEVLDTTQVSTDTIKGLLEVIMKIIVPKQRPELKSQITYLINLQARQAEVWKNYTEDCQNRANNTSQWVRQNAR